MKFLVLMCLVSVALGQYTLMTMYYDNAACDDTAAIFMQEWYAIPEGEAACVPVDCFGLANSQSIVQTCPDTQPTLTIVNPTATTDLLPADDCTGATVGQVAVKDGIVPVPSTSVVPCDPFAECCDFGYYYESYMYCLGDNYVEVDCYDVDCLTCTDATEISACTTMTMGAWDYYYIDACVDDTPTTGYMRVTMYDDLGCAAGTESQQFVASVPATWMCVDDPCQDLTVYGRKIECVATEPDTTITGGQKATIFSDDACTVNVGKMAAAPLAASIDYCDPMKDCCYDTTYDIYVKVKCLADAQMTAYTCGSDSTCKTCTETTMSSCMAMTYDQEPLIDVLYYDVCSGSMLTAAVAMLSLFFALF